MGCKIQQHTHKQKRKNEEKVSNCQPAGFFPAKFQQETLYYFQLRQSWYVMDPLFLLHFMFASFRVLDLVHCKGEQGQEDIIIKHNDRFR